jgi:hypothetical protein
MSLTAMHHLAGGNRGKSGSIWKAKLAAATWSSPNWVLLLFEHHLCHPGRVK